MPKNARVILVILTSLLLIGSYLFIPPKEVGSQADPSIIVSQLPNGTVTKIEFFITANYEFTGSPSITIYSGHGCTGPEIFIQQGVTVDPANRSQGTYEWTGFPVEAEFSVKVTDTFRDPPLASNCLNGTTPSPGPEPPPPPPEPTECDSPPTFSRTQPLLPREGDSVTVYFRITGDTPPVDQHRFYAKHTDEADFGVKPFVEEGGEYKSDLGNITRTGAYLWRLEQIGATVRCSEGDFSVAERGSGNGDGGPFGPITRFADVFNPVQTFNTLGGIISAALPFVFGFAALIALLFLIWGGFRYMTAQGDEKLVAEARATITSAIIGLVIVFAVVALAQLIETVFKINIFG